MTVALASAISVPQSSEPPATLTRGCTDATTTANHITLDIYRSPQKAPLTRGSKDDSPAYSNIMLDIYRVVTACGQPNFRGARLPLPINFDFHQWSAIAHTQADLEVLQYLKYGFPTGCEGPIPTPSFENHYSAVNHPRDIKAYIATALSEGAMLGPFP